MLPTQFEDLMKLNKDLKSGVELLPHQDSGFQQAKMELQVEVQYLDQAFEI